MDIGTLQRLGEVGTKKLWPSEDRHFSPWLADNISYINNVLNIQIEIEEAEGSVDNFRLDLSGMDGISQRPVVIENQYGKSNHDHLGKLITYSADREAGIVIWISNVILPAHRKAVEWLNERTPHDMSFYAIELDVLQIDDSRLAPNFTLVAGPRPSKRREAVPPDQVSPRNKQYQAFFAKLRVRLLELQPNFTKARGLPQNWWGLGMGRTGFSLAASFTAEGNFRVEIYIDTGIKEDNESILLQLEESKSSIEEKIGVSLIWDYLHEARACRVYVTTDGTIDDEGRLHELIEWAAPLMIRFRETFAPLIKNLDISTGV